MNERPGRQYSCCAGSTWVRGADLGHTQGLEFTLGKCSVCGRYWMHLWTPHSADAGYVALDADTVARLTALKPGPNLRRALEELFDL